MQPPRSIHVREVDPKTKVLFHRNDIRRKMFEAHEGITADHAVSIRNIVFRVVPLKRLTQRRVLKKTGEGTCLGSGDHRVREVLVPRPMIQTGHSIPRVADKSEDKCRIRQPFHPVNIGQARMLPQASRRIEPDKAATPASRRWGVADENIVSFRAVLQRKSKRCSPSLGDVHEDVATARRDNHFFRRSYDGMPDKPARNWFVRGEGIG